jgi:histidine triad (HIT) family protein
MKDCIFCHIAKGTAPASKVYSNERILAFLDIHPVNPGHILIIPKKHTAQLSDLDEETGGIMFKTAMQVAAALRRSGVRCEGVTLHLADGEAAFQEVFHVHLHVIPRFKGDGFGLKFGPDYGRKPDREELERTARRIAIALKEK